MSVGTQVDEQLLEHFWWWVEERHQIYRRRFEVKSQPPWTTDPIMLVNRFTNVYRDLDTGSAWIANYLQEHPPAQLVDVIWTLTIYRLLNRIETYERHGIPSRDVESIRAWFEKVYADQANGIKVATGSHCTRVKGLDAYLYPWADDAVILPVIEEIAAAPSIAEAQKALKVMDGVGNFFGLQIVIDYAVSPWSHLGADTLVSVVQGSQYAIDLMITEAPTRTNRAVLLDRLHDEQRTPTGGRPLTYIDLEHSLCEWGKYYRLMTNPKKAKLRRFRSGDLVPST